MRVILIEKTSNRGVNKDQMGGYGIDTQTGTSLLARCIARQKKNMRNIPVLSLAYLGGIFLKSGHHVSALNDDSIPEADLFIIASSIVDYKSELLMASRIKEKFPKAKVGFVGPFAAFLSEEYLKAGDFIIKGEPESAAGEIARGHIPKGIVESNNMDDLDSLPYPAWELFEVNSYSYSPTVNRKPFLTMQTSRGCAFSCAYCPYLTYQKNYRPRRVENIIEEIGYLKKRFGIRGLLFRDPLFTFKKDRCMQLAESMIKNRFNLEWACETRTDVLDKELIDIMYTAGLRAVNLGIESSNQEILHNASRKAVDIKRQEDIIRYCEKKGMKVIAFYILGLSDDTPNTIKETIRYSKKLNTFLAQFHVFTPFPGTQFYEDVKDAISECEWEKFNSFNPVFRHKNISADELSSLKERAFVSYYFRPSYAAKHMRHLLPLWKKALPK